MSLADKLTACLVKGGRQELGIPIVLPSFADAIQDIAKWALTGSPVEGRQFWFGVGNATELRDSFPPELRGRILPFHPSLCSLVMNRGPYDALLLPTHGFLYSDPNLLVSDFWKQRGSYQKNSEFEAPDLVLWFWVSHRKPMKLFGMDHHHAVLWDVKQILRPLGVQVDFVWLADGRPPVNEAIPCQIPSFLSSLDIYKPPADQPMPEDAKSYIAEENYDGILTSHSLITCHRLKDLNLPMIHVNSTRFGNEWIHQPEKHTVLVQSLEELLHTNRLRVVHNNKGDFQYFHQYFPKVSPSQEVIIPSLCESIARLREKVVKPTKLLVWDTRQVLLQQKGSPFMKMMMMKLKEALGDSVDSQAVLMAQAQSYLPEGYLDAYTAVIHIPYNVSTMSMFQHARANIPIWVPSKRLLKELWTNPEEPNELSWTVFVPGSEGKASYLDQARNPDVVERWIDTADFYNPDVLPLCLQFDSVEELIEKAMTTDYQALMDKAEQTQQQRRENITFAWEQVLKGVKENGLKGHS